MTTKKLSQEQFIERCVKIHGKKFDYSQAKYINSGTKFTVKCNSCQHTWEVTPANHIGPSASGCPECKRNKQFGRSNKSQKQFLDEIIKIHNDRYMFDQVRYINCNTKVSVGCRIHGYFDKWPNDLLHGSGCPYCANNKVNVDAFLKKIKQRHSDFDFSEYKYISAKTESVVICKEHGRLAKHPNALNNTAPNKLCVECNRAFYRASMIEQGKIRDPKDVPEYEKYRAEVWKISNKQFIEHYYEINPENIRRGVEFHLDHKLSIFEGWKAQVAPEVMGSKHNLRIIPATENRQKSYKSSIEVAALLELFNSSSPI